MKLTLESEYGAHHLTLELTKEEANEAIRRGILLAHRLSEASGWTSPDQVKRFMEYIYECYSTTNS